MQQGKKGRVGRVLQERADRILGYPQAFQGEQVVGKRASHWQINPAH